MTRTPRRCLLAAGLASFLVPVVAMPAVSAESPYVDHVVQGGAVLFPHPVAPRSRLLVDPPVPRQASAKPRRSEAPSPPSVTAAPEPDQRPAPSAAPQSESAEARSAAPQPAPAKPAKPASPEASVRPETKPAQPVKASGQPDQAPETPPTDDTTPPEPSGQTQAGQESVPQPPPLPDLPPPSTAPAATAATGATDAPQPEAKRDQPSQATDAPAATPAGDAAPPIRQGVQSASPEAERLTIAFAPDAAEPLDDVSESLEALATRLKDDPFLRLRLNAYAPGTEAEQSRSRRLSLSRALAVRSRLVDAGVESTRIEVRALGNADVEGSRDRVDIIVLER